MKISLLASGLAILSACTTSVRATPTPTLKHLRKRGPPSGFAYAEGGDFKIDGKSVKFGGTNAYWMFLLNEEADIINTFAQYKASAVGLVRIWAFREAVGTAPASGNYTQLWKNGVATCSPDGIARLTFILDTAQSFGIKVIFALTNNWSVEFPASVTATKPPGYYSNTYGGLDTYVQQIKPGSPRDAFYTDADIIAAYQKWLGCVVPPHKTHAALFSWELANDPRCQGADGTSTSSSCTTTTVTKWVKQQAAHLKQLDPNHMAAAGEAGFLCTQSTCVKINTPAVSAPQISQGPLVTRKRRRWLTTADVLARARESEKLARGAVVDAAKRVRVRGGWSAPEPVRATVTKNKRQDAGTLGHAYNGFWGVDSQDICADENVDFCTLQIFPDQDNYSVGATLSKRATGSDSSPGTTTQSVSDAVNFILNQAKDKSKPVAALAVGVTSSSHSNRLNHFHSTNVGSNSNQAVASDSQQQTAVSKISSTASSINAMFPWQQGSSKVSSKSGSIVAGDSSLKRQVDITGPTGSTPDDGYAYFPGDAIYNIWLNTNKQLAGSS